MSEDAKMKPFRIDWSSRSKLRGPGERSLGDLLLKLRNRLAPAAEGISITYLDNKAMRKLNREYRSVNQTTDVLSFPTNPEKGAFNHLGDLVISLPVAEKVAKKLGVSRRREIETLVIHGFLHLCMYDHEVDNGEMMLLQAELELDFLESEPLVMAVRRGRKPGSKVKHLRDGSRVIITGHAANKLVKKETVRKSDNVKKLGKTFKGNSSSYKHLSINSKKDLEQLMSSPRRIIRRKNIAHRLRNGVLC